MIISKCCKAIVFVKDKGDNAHYMCDACHLPCNTITTLTLDVYSLDKDTDGNREAR